jgi:putative sterol carrier protein
MATVDECRAALQEIAARLAGDPDARRKIDLDRSFVCYIRDLEVSFRGRISGGTVTGPADGDDPDAQIRLAMTGDDLLAMVRGDLNFAAAWATGRVAVKAGVGDLLKLRKLL